jgi:two-component system, cell cycle response regulator
MVVSQPPPVESLQPVSKEPEPVSAAKQQRVPTVVRVRDRPGARSRAVLAVTGGPDVGRVISLPSEEVELGRSEQCAVRFDDQGLSRVHAVINRALSVYVFTDRASTNGSFVNDEKVAGSTVLRDGDHIRLGADTTLRFSMVDEAEELALRQVYESAARDALTGAANRKSFDERLSADLAFSVRHRTPLAVLLVDIDFFKRVNDEHGHLAGDAVLKSTARALERSVRLEDLVARYGGEEFGVIARGSELTRARKMAERLRRAIAAEDVVHDGKQIRVTASIGVASLACCPEGSDKTALVSLADKRLYRAKELGRNRVVSD